MNRLLRVPVACAAVIGLAAWAAILTDRGAAQDLDPEEVKRSIDLGVRYLLREQAQDGTWPSWLSHDTTPLCTLALLNAGVSPKDEPLQRALTHIRKRSRRPSTYVIALEIMALCAAEPQKDLDQIREDALYLVKNQITRDGLVGTWGYPGSSGDNSNTQFALLGLYEAERTLERYKVPSPIPPETWKAALAHFERTQNGDGSWGYTLGTGADGTGSMTCAGISSVIIAAGRLNRGGARIDGGRVTCCTGSQANEAVRKGLAWLGRQDNFSVYANPGSRGGVWHLYYLYALERVGRLTAQRFIGQHDWYREGTAVLVRNQDKISGYWKGTGPGEQVGHLATAFALLFLAKGRRPVLFSKAQFGPPTSNDWNNHPSDCANLTEHVEQQWKRDLAWQVVNANTATADDYLQSPILFISGSREIECTPEQIRELRAYVDRGGFIFAEACCDDSQAFHDSFKRLIDQQVFPEVEYDLRVLGPEHEVWAFEDERGRAYLGKLWGVNVGCRTSVIYCEDRLSCYWELAQSARGEELPPAVQQNVDAALAIGLNVAAYATNRELRYKYEIPSHTAPEVKASTLERALTVIGKLRHSGGWNAAPGALVRLQKELNQYAGVLVPTDQRELDITDPKLFDHHLLFLHGRNAFVFSDAERKALGTFVERGGMIFADAVCGSEAFTRSFRAEIEKIFPGQKLERIDPAHKLFTAAYGGFDLKTVKRRDPPRTKGQGPVVVNERDVPPELEGLKVGEVYGVIFSRYDLSCALESHESPQCTGYSREDAARIGINVVLYSLHELGELQDANPGR